MLPLAKDPVDESLMLSGCPEKEPEPETEPTVDPVGDPDADTEAEADTEGDFDRLRRNDGGSGGFAETSRMHTE